MTCRTFFAAMAVASMVSFSMSGSAFASERHRHGVHRDAQVELGGAHRDHKRSAQRVADRSFNDQPYAGYRTDIAGNSYFYYRVGADTPFGPGRGLRPPYPR